MKKINLETFKILKNLVLVKVDPHYETYQRGGKDLGILVSNFEYSNGARTSIKEKNYSVTGTVYVVPQKLVCNTKKMVRIAEKMPMTFSEGAAVIHDRSLLEQKDRLLKDTLQFGTTVELQVGDRIRYSYTAHQNAIDSGMEVETSEGKMVLMSYDKIFMTVDENLYPKKMVNGYVAVKELTNPDVVFEDGINQQKTESGLVIVNNNTKQVQKRKGMKVECVLAGEPLTSYLAMPHIGADSNEVLNPGDLLLIDPRGKQRLEPHNHQHIEEEIFLIQRRQIILKNMGNFEDIKL